MVLECCVAARATVLITGDSELLELAPGVSRVSGLRRLRILSLRAYLGARFGEEKLMADESKSRSGAATSSGTSV
jgi:hypothetical protein